MRFPSSVRIGHVPVTKIVSGYADTSTDPAYFFQVKDSPFGGALPVMVPAVDADSIVTRSEIDLAHFAEALDGLVLQGGNDLAPESYGETPMHPDWHGDRVRDLYHFAVGGAVEDQRLTTRPGYAGDVTRRA